MVKKYARILKERQDNDRTGKVWAIQDVPKTWRKPTQAQVLADGYIFLEDGTAWNPKYPIPDGLVEE